jgi:hypothetical protein
MEGHVTRMITAVEWYLNGLSEGEEPSEGIIENLLADESVRPELKKTKAPARVVDPAEVFWDTLHELPF